LPVFKNQLLREERTGKGAYIQASEAFALVQLKKRTSLPTLGKRLKRWGVGEALTREKLKTGKSATFMLCIFLIFES